MTTAPLLDSRTDIDQVPGWFARSDQELFRWFLGHQTAQGTTGHVVEVGAYLGKSAVLIGDHVADGETFTIVDLFGAEPGDLANAAENRGSYSTLTREGFEENYLKFHPALPDVHTGLSSEVVEHVAPGSARFMHIDASHLYEHVVGDTAAARSLLAADGIVVYDDYRSEHTPGVSAAVWQAVLNDDLRPICVSGSKLYGTWGDPAPWSQALLAHLESREDSWHETQQVAGHTLIRCKLGEPTTTREQQLRAAIAQRDEALTEARKRLGRQRRRVAALESSTSYRLGRALTAPARALRRG